MATGNELAFLTKERRVIDAELHVHSWLIDRYDGQWFRVIDVRYGLPDLESLYTYYCTNITALHFCDFLLAHVHKYIQLLYFAALQRAVYFTEHYILAFLHS